jgi:cytochrome c-type biogenesis protein CcmH
VSRLEQRLAGAPNDLSGWLLLGRSYLALGRFEAAATAYDRAVELSGGSSANAWLGFGEAVSLRAGGEITVPAAESFERALKLEPQNPQALMYGGFAAATRGDKDLARERWLRVKAMNPPPQIARLIDSHLATLTAPGVAAAEGPGQPPSPAPASPAGAASSDDSPATNSAQARVTVQLAPALKSRSKPDAAMFVFAREPGVPGPPLAVKRLSTASLGATVTLSAADAMVAGRELRAGHKVAITARISFTGRPLPTTGDLYGELTYDVGKDGVRNLVIDRVSN